VRIDIAVLAVLALFGLFGLMSGAIRQLAHFGGLVVGILFARQLGQLAGPVVAARLNYPLLPTTVAASFVAFLLLYIGVVFVLRMALGKLFPDGERGALNRLGGFAMGAAKAAAVILVLLSLALIAGRSLQSLWPGWKGEERSSIAAGLARRYSPFTHLPQFGGIERLARASRDPQAAARLAQNPDFKVLARDPRLQALSQDPAVQSALRSGDWAGALGSPLLLEALEDPKVGDRLMRLSGAPE